MKLGKLIAVAVCAWSMGSAGVACAQDTPGERGMNPAGASAPLASGYFTVRQDTRRCAAPLCGGFFVRLVNRNSTRCADGSARSECRVATLDLAQLRLDPDAQLKLLAEPNRLLLRGSIVRGGSPDVSGGDSLRVVEAAVGHAGVSPTGTFYRVTDNGIVCITAPCLSLSAERLNSDRAAESIAGLDLTRVAPDPSDGLAQLRNPGGLLVAAKRTTVSGPGGRARALAASEYFLPFFTGSARDGQPCGSRGLGQCATDEFCSFPPGANCGRADAPGMCAVRPQVCTREFNPVCGCDGMTYPNACTAAAAGVSVEFRGECPQP